MNAAQRIQGQVIGGAAERCLQVFGQAIDTEEGIGHSRRQYRGCPAHATNQRKGQQVAIDIGGAMHQQGIGERQGRGSNTFTGRLDTAQRRQAFIEHLQPHAVQRPLPILLPQQATSLCQKRIRRIGFRQRRIPLFR